MLKKLQESSSLRDDDEIANEWIKKYSPFAEHEVQLHTISTCMNKMQSALQIRGMPGPGVTMQDHPFLITSQKIWDNIEKFIRQISDQVGLTYSVEDVYYTEGVVKVSWSKAPACTNNTVKS